MKIFKIFLIITTLIGFYINCNEAPLSFVIYFLSDQWRKVIEHDVYSSEKQCNCGCQKECFGEEITEQLEIIPMQLSGTV